MVKTTAKGLLGSSQCPVLEIRSNVLRHLSMFVQVPDPFFFLQTSRNIWSCRYSFVVLHGVSRSIMIIKNLSKCQNVWDYPLNNIEKNRDVSLC